MSENQRRPHIGLKPKGIKKTRPWIVEENEGEERPIFTSNTEELKENLTTVKNNKVIRDKENDIFIEKEYYFIIELFNKISWTETQRELKKLPIKIKEIIDETTIKVKLNKMDYDNFYEALSNLNQIIKNIKQININDKINVLLFKEISENTEAECKITLELYDINKGIDIDDYQIIENYLFKYIIKNDGNIEKIFESEHDVLYSIKIKNRNILQISRLLDSITWIDKDIEITLIDNLGGEKLNFIETSPIIAKDSTNLFNICIIDSGIFSQHNRFSGLISSTFDLLTNNYLPCSDNIPHGTCVSGFAIYGENPSTTVDPSAKIIMIKNYDRNGIQYLNSLSAITNSIERYRNQFKIMNLSFGSTTPNPSYTRALDSIIFRNKIITVVSAGNLTLREIQQSLQNGETYPSYLIKYPIYFPGDCHNAITVGGCTHISSNLAPSDAPAPFTKTNPFSTLVKPDVLALSGNLQIIDGAFNIDGQNLGLRSLSNNGNFIERHGTSFSAPIVANMIAQLMSKLGITNPALLKAILLNSTSFLRDGNYYFDSNMQGFGKPNLEYALFSNIWRCCYLMEGECNISRRNILDRYEIWFPEKADMLEVTLVCEKSETIYRNRVNDYVQFRIHHRPGTSSRTYLESILGNVKCFNTFKGEYFVERGSRGKWSLDIIPNFSQKELFDLKMRYGCVVTVKDSTKKNNIWDLINTDWLEELLGENAVDEQTQNIGLLRPIIVEPRLPT